MIWWVEWWVDCFEILVYSFKHFPSICIFFLSFLFILPETIPRCHMFLTCHFIILYYRLCFNTFIFIYICKLFIVYIFNPRWLSHVLFMSEVSHILLLVTRSRWQLKRLPAETLPWSQHAVKFRGHKSCERAILIPWSKDHVALRVGASHRKSAPSLVNTGYREESHVMCHNCQKWQLKEQYLRKYFLMCPMKWVRSW